MALQTPVRDINFQAPDFLLIGTDGETYALADVKGPKGLLVMFICNHCPYVKSSIDRLVDDCRALKNAGIGCVAIMPNDTHVHTDDSFDRMKDFAHQHHFPFPYLIDETQDVARAYGAVCTPDLFGFNAAGALQYRGRIDSAGPKAETADGATRELLDAMLMIAETGQGPEHQNPSMGCSIKWRA